jgi:peptide/nickel transport system substrate-binding protein
MSESVEPAAWERPLTRRDVLVKGVAAGGVFVAGGALARAASARPTAAWIASRRAASATLVVANFGDMQNLDPYTSSADQVTGDILTNLYAIPATFQLDGTHNGARFAQSTKFRGQVASGWKWSKNKKEIVFTIRKGIKFPDGSPIDAAAVKFSLDRCFDVKAVGSFLFSMVGLNGKDQIDVLDSQSVRFTLPKPTSLLFGNMAMFYGSAVMNPAIVKQHATSADPTAQGWFKTHTAESGPYTLKDWNVGSGWTLEANPNFWEPVATKTVQFQVIPDAQQRELLVKSGRVDLALGVPLKDVPSLRKSSNLNVVSVPTREVAFAGFDVTKKPFDNKLVRQAILYAIPYQTIMQQVLYGQGVQLRSPIPAGTPDSDFHYWHYDTDYAKAKSLLAKAGYPKGFSTQLDIQTGSALDEQTASWIQQGLQKIGISVSINKQPSAAFTSQLQAKKHAFWFSSTSWISINNDPLYHLYWLYDQSCCTYGNYLNPKVRGLINKWVNAPLDDPKRVAAVRQAQKIIVDDAPWIFLFQPPQVYVTSKSVKGLVYYPTDLFLRYQYFQKT